MIVTDITRGASKTGGEEVLAVKDNMMHDGDFIVGFRECKRVRRSP